MNSDYQNKILVTGPEFSGKTTLINFLKNGLFVQS